MIGEDDLRRRLRTGELAHVDGLQRLWADNGGDEPRGKALDFREKIAGRDLLLALLELHETFGDMDPAFGKAIVSLVSWGIIDNHGKYPSDALTPLEAKRRATLLDMVQDFEIEGLSQHRACQMAAALSGTRSNSFDAATKKVKRLVQEFGQTLPQEMSSDS